MARVLADDMALDYVGSDPYLTLVGTAVNDATGNANGRLDPGETADITALLKNVGGIDLTNVNATLECSDAYIAITDNAAHYGVIMIDSTVENTGDPFTVVADSGAPQGHEAAFSLIVSDGAYTDTFEFELVLGTYHYLVWNPDPTPAQGQVIHTTLQGLGYSGLISTTLPQADLGLFRCIFVCVGIYPNNYTIAVASPEAVALVAYANNGGRLYLEGGDVWYYDPMVGGYNFCSLFGISATADGTSDMGPVQGQAGTFTNEMLFGYSSENSYMDHISPSGSGAFEIFRDQDNSYGCGVARDQGTYRTVGVSFQLGGLTDGSGVSTKAALVDSIMHFFGITLIGIAEEEEHKAGGREITLTVTPNPFAKNARIQCAFGAVQSKAPTLAVYDASGRLVRTLAVSSDAGAVTWNGCDEQGAKLPAGVYFVRATAGTAHIEQKVILTR